MTEGNTARKRSGREDRSALRSVGGGRQSMHTESLDTLIHERTRLAIISALAVNDALSFSELKGQLGLSDGNLSVHAQKLETAGYIRCKKTFKGRTPRTEYKLTPKGRKILEAYLDHMETLIATVRRT